MATIRQANLDDFEAVVALNYELFKLDNQWFEEYDVNWPYSEDGQKYFRNVVEAEDGNVCFIAEVDGEIVGYLAGNLKRNNSVFKRSQRAELENMYVLETYRSQGIGAKLVESFVDFCKANDKQTIKVVASVENLRAVSFYQKHGFVKRYVELDLEQE